MLSVLRKARLKDKEMRILMLGLDNSGKTTIVKRIMNEDVNSVSPTLGFIIKTIDYEGKPFARTGKTTSRRQTRSSGSLMPQTVSAWKTAEQSLKRLMGASLLVFKNKSDVPGCMTTDDIREGLQLDSISTHKWHILPCSAMTGQNLHEGLQWVVQDAKDRLFLY
ncbi:hypothetical protein D0861_04805 [Hortaea werneckii]|uniref:ADP-ribosylation factor-like protein 3 n=1 Tax=Hortaea werneckii TaxID=91943 RepID=A0A3M7FHX5_HORWE|nr:hypothetical protein D0861_04805 [Hortaea werneckii]